MERLVNFLAGERELSITLTSEGYDELAAGASFADLIEQETERNEWGQVGWTVTTADRIGCLSSAPVLWLGDLYNYEAETQGMSEEEAARVWGEPVWYFYPDYAIRLEEDDLKRTGVVVYKRGY